jgi:hypothetical protein
MWGRKKKQEPCPESQKARREAADALQEAEDQWGPVRDVTQSLQHIQHRNNFAEAVEKVLRGSV